MSKKFHSPAVWYALRNFLFFYVSFRALILELQYSIETSYRFIIKIDCSFNHNWTQTCYNSFISGLLRMWWCDIEERNELKSILKGIVQRKLLWVESVVNRWLVHPLRPWMLRRTQHRFLHLPQVGKLSWGHANSPYLGNTSTDYLQRSYRDCFDTQFSLYIHLNRMFTRLYITKQTLSICFFSLTLAMDNYPLR
jgi:hypothetical protein